MSHGGFDLLFIIASMAIGRGDHPEKLIDDDRRFQADV